MWIDLREILTSAPRFATSVAHCLLRNICEQQFRTKETQPPFSQRFFCLSHYWDSNQWIRLAGELYSVGLFQSFTWCLNTSDVASNLFSHQLSGLSLNVEYDRRHHFLLFQVFVRLIMLSWGVCIVATSAERQQLLMKPLVAICFVFTTLNFVTCLRHNNASADSLGFSVS